MRGVVPVTRVRDCAGALNRLSARRRGAKRIIGLVVMIGTERLAVKDVKGFVRKGFLHASTSMPRSKQGCAETYVTGMAIEALSVVFAFELAVRGRHCLFFYG